LGHDTAGLIVVLGVLFESAFLHLGVVKVFAAAIILSGDLIQSRVF
jgi:hypothetical protein